MKKLKSLLTAAVVGISFLGTAVTPAGSISNEIIAEAASVAYPVQEFRLGLGDTDNNVVADGISLKPSVMTGEDSEKWSLNYVSSGVYEIVSSVDGKILTASETGVSLAADTDSASQRWKIEGVQKDCDGYYLYYKITSNADSSKSLTYIDGTGFGLASYNGGIYQKYKLNLDGLEGYAANCMTPAGEKTGTIGGLLGEVVYVSTADELEKQANTAEPKTIVVTADIDMRKKSHTRVRDNKTIVGCYGNHTIYDSMFRTNNEYGNEGDEPSDNIIFRNLKMVAKNEPNRILINIWSSRQIWIDHIYFESQLIYDRKGNGQDEVGKFIWINTPYENYMDAKDRLRSPDYITISYCHFKNRYWTVAYGTQNDEITRDRTTLLYNWWDENVRRCPQIGNGSAHVYNNYYSAYGTDGNGSATSGIIGGDGSDIVSQNNRFQGYSLQQALMMGGGSELSRDDNSYISSSVSGTPSKVSFSPKKASLWNPEKTNYGYSLLDSYNTNGTDTKDFCTKYAGDKLSPYDMKYITDSEFSSWITAKYPSPFLIHAELDISSAASFNDGSAYRFRNVKSGLYMQVEGAKAENGTNVQQWGTADGVTHDIWRLIDAGGGYYYIASAVGDGGTYMLDVAGKKTANGTNIDIYHYNGDTNQQFMITKNPDGSYKLRTRISNGKSAVEIADASVQSGANVQQWEINGASCQDWILEEVSNPGCIMDTSVVYEFENVNSAMVMDIESGKMEADANVQQWSTGHFKSQQWTLQAFSGGGNYYYIRSYSDPKYVLRADGSINGGNISIAEYSSKDSAMLFKFAKNPDGTYYIMTRASKDVCLVEIAAASTSSGANVQQWSPTNNNCQKWTVSTMTTAATTTTTTTASTTSSTTTKQPVETPVSGDINCDGKVTIADAVMLQKYILQTGTLTKEQGKYADLDMDGVINSFDMVLLRRIIISK